MRRGVALLRRSTVRLPAPSLRSAPLHRATPPAFTDFDACGVTGEDTNKLVGYLAALSRKFDKPLGVIIQSTSAAGKTTLMEAVLSFIPEEDRVKLSAATQSAPVCGHF